MGTAHGAAGTHHGSPVHLRPLYEPSRLHLHEKLKRDSLRGSTQAGMPPELAALAAALGVESAAAS